MLVPLLSEFEDERIVLNCEHRAQKTTKIFESFGDCRNIKQILVSIFNNISISRKQPTKFYDFIYNTIENPRIFDMMEKKYIKLFNFAGNNTFSSSLSKYPIKNLLEDFYCSTNYTKNSITMLQSTTYLRNSSHNFKTTL